MTKEKNEKLYLIDGSGYIFRAFHALPPMTRQDGVPVNAVYGFCVMLHKLLADMNAQKIVVVFDAARKTFRNNIYPEYKAHRPPPPEELVPQFPLIRDAVKAFGVPSIEAEGYEADDLIASAARAAQEKGWSICIVSADKDLMQLVRDGVELYDPMKGKTIGPTEVEAKFGVPPDKVVDVQALAGDSADNVPGVPGIGVKTAAQLILEYGSLEALLARAEEIKQPKRRQALLDNAELARISMKLVRLDDRAPLPLALEDMRRLQDNDTMLRAFLKAHAFKSLLARMEKQTSGDTAPLDVPCFTSFEPHTQTTATEQTYVLIKDLAALRAFVDEARAQGYVALDTETTSLVPSQTKLVGASFALSLGRACYVPLGHVDPTHEGGEGGLFSAPVAAPPEQITPFEFAQAVRELLIDPSVLKIGHNLKFDMQVLKSACSLDVFPYDDTMLLSYVLGAGAHGHGLDELALRHYGHKMISFKEVTGKGKARTTFEHVPLDQACAYAAEDADFTLRLWHTLKPKVIQNRLLRVYERLERPLVPVIAAMETAGVKIDPMALKRQSDVLAARMQTLESAVYALAKHPFNLASPKQLGEVLFTELGLPGGIKGKTGAYATSHDVLEPLAESGHDIVVKLLDWRGLSKLKNTYTDALPEQINQKTRRIHTSFSMVGAATGRLSSTDPNLQNIPIRTPEGRAIRQAFIAEDGCVLVSVDYAQIEMRLAASMAGIGALLQAFRENEDIHAITASQVFGIPLAEMTPEKRRQAKAINFGIIYGISGFGLAKQLGVAPGEASAFIKAYLEKFHELRSWMETTKAFARAHGYVETLFGRRVHIQDIASQNPARRSGAERQAINAPIQGTAADLMKRAMIRVPSALKAAGLGSRLLVQVHDELVLEAREDEAAATLATVKHIMENTHEPVVSLKVPLIATGGIGKTWASAH